ncbi:MAG: hypothetical protein KDD89_01475 [Anaerolineales bacterium]|nr:hypothetical protein [Anaerolineales bacterium]
MKKYKEPWNDLPTAEKQTAVPGRGLRRFLVLLAILLGGLALLFFWPEAEPDNNLLLTATPTAVSGVSVNTAVDAAPNVSVNVEAPPPAVQPAPPDNTAALMANETARDARAVADSAMVAVNALAPRVAAVETRTAAVDDIPPTLLRFEQSAADTAADISLLSWFLVATLVFLFALCLVVGWLVLRPPTPAHGLVIDQRPDYEQNRPEPTRTVLRTEAVPLVEPVNTVQNGSARTDSEPMKLDPSRPLTLAERRMILHWYTILHSYTAVAKYIYGYKNDTTFNRVKDVVSEVQQHD